MDQPAQQQRTSKPGRIWRVAAGLVGLAMLASVATSYAAAKDDRHHGGEYWQNAIPACGRGWNPQTGRCK